MEKKHRNMLKIKKNKKTIFISVFFSMAFLFLKYCCIFWNYKLLKQILKQNILLHILEEKIKQKSRKAKNKAKNKKNHRYRLKMKKKGKMHRHRTGGVSVKKNSIVYFCKFGIKVV